MEKMNQIEIKSLTLQELEQELEKLGEKKFRAKQIFQWLHRGVSDFEEMTNLSKDLRRLLSQHFLLTHPEIMRKQISKIDGTIKYLWKLHDGNCVESVWMEYHHGNTVCVSSQVGCRMGCKFCASTIGGLVRNLSAGEILDQVLFMSRDTGKKVSNIVLMGTGEPLDNYDAVLKFIHLLGDPNGICIGQRHISLSTCGLADQIDRLAQEKLQITLSISLHSPDNESRSQTMPINKRYPIERLLKSCENYFDITSRRISYEYTMIDGISDRPWQAEKLAKLLRSRPNHINLIPLNAVVESGLQPSKKANIVKFQSILEKYGIPATVRRKLGPDIDASCGQLRRRTLEEMM